MGAHMSKAVILALLLSSATSASSGEHPQTPAADAPAPHVAMPVSALTSFPAVDTSRLDPVGKAFFEKVANEEVCPCDCPKSFGQCLQEGTRCKPAVILAHWIIKNLEDGDTPEQLQESITRELTGGFGSAVKKIDAGGFASRGPANAKYTVIEFADYECPHCRAASPVVEELVKTHPDVKAVYKHYPLPFHAMARPAAIAAEAAGRQGKFWEMHNAIFATQDLLSDDLLIGHAKALGLDVARFKKDMADPELVKKVDASQVEGKALGVEFTPYFFVNGRPYFLARSIEGFDVRFRMEDARASSSCQ